MSAPKPPETQFPVYLTESEITFLLYTLGYMAGVERDPKFKQFVDENHDSILPKLAGATKGIKGGLEALAAKATNICCLAQGFPETPDRAKIVELSAEITNVLGALRPKP